MIGKIFGDYKIIKEERIKKEKNYILECLVCGAKLNCRVREFDKYKQEIFLKTKILRVTTFNIKEKFMVVPH